LPQAATPYKHWPEYLCEWIGPMKFVMLGFLVLAAIALTVALVVGASSQVVGIILLVLAVMVIATFVVGKLRGILNLELDRRLPRALLTNDRR
jgi:uncharacterized oligopeptide transporter (OPT) family protein